LPRPKASSNSAADSKLYGLALLPQRDRSKPDRDYAILTEWKTVVAVSGDLQSKAPIAPNVIARPLWRPSHGEPAEDERPRIESYSLPSLFPRSAHHLEVLQAPALSFRDDLNLCRRGLPGEILQKGKLTHMYQATGLLFHDSAMAQTVKLNFCSA
jgi:hypothetical protein